MNQELIDRVLKCPRLPSLPTIALQVIELCRKPDVNVNELASIISNDPALSGKILRTVNSSFYGMSSTISTISHALVILGLSSVKTLALGFSLISRLKEQQGDQSFDMLGFWRRMLYSAVGARAIAQKARVAQHEEAFLGGLLQDVGVMAMIQALGDEYLPLLAKTGGDHTRLSALEREALDVDHLQIGAMLAEKWKLPPVLIAPIRHHESPDQADVELCAMVRCVALGGRAADVYVRNDPAAVEPFLQTLEQWFSLDKEAGQKLLDKIGESTREMAKLFDIHTAEDRDLGSILAEANETLLQLSLETQQSASELEQRNKQLQEQAIRDPLTGVANRGHFNEFIKRQFTAVTQGHPGAPGLGLIFLDVDKFKSVNDTHGHQTGDAVLVWLAGLLTQHCPEGALVARYGGEEFAVILPGHTRKQSAMVAERIRKAVESTPFKCSEQLTLNLTISIGVACYEGPGSIARWEQLVAAADKAVYAAKNSGRNCVRVFSPKPAQPVSIARSSAA